MAVSSLSSLLKAEPAALQWTQQRGLALVATAELYVGVMEHRRSALLED